MARFAPIEIASTDYTDIEDRTQEQQAGAGTIIGHII